MGGDQFLCGSRRYYAQALVANEWKTFFACLEADRCDVGLSRSLWWVFRHGCYPLLPDSARQLFRKIIIGNRSGGVDRQAWLKPPMERVIRQRRDQHNRSRTERKRRGGPREQEPVLSDGYLAHALELEERLAASVGIELRRPFFDSNFVQLACSIPDRFKLRGRIDKYLHRKAMTGRLPETIIMRETKAEFSITLRWYKSELQEMFTQEASYWACDWVDSGKVAKLHSLGDHLPHSSMPARMLWTLFGCKALDSKPGRGPPRHTVSNLTLN
ncbi:MAG: asparagine synthase-related protein [Chromatiaceae bacterium]